MITGGLGFIGTNITKHLLNNNFNTEMLIYGKLTTMLIELDLYKILEKCKANILKFGGHKYAAGLTIEENDYASFKESFEKEVGDYINNKLPENEIRIESKNP